MSENLRNIDYDSHDKFILSLLLPENCPGYENDINDTTPIKRYSVHKLSLLLPENCPGYENDIYDITPIKRCNKSLNNKSKI